MAFDCSDETPTLNRFVIVFKTQESKNFYDLQIVTENFMDKFNEAKKSNNEIKLKEIELEKGKEIEDKKDEKNDEKNDEKKEEKKDDENKEKPEKKLKE